MTVLEEKILFATTTTAPITIAIDGAKEDEEKRIENCNANMRAHRNEVINSISKAPAVSPIERS